MRELNYYIRNVEELDHTKKKLTHTKKKLTHTKKVAVALLFVLCIAVVQQARANPPPPYPKITNFTADPTTADVGEPVNFTWTIIGFFDIAIMSFGDGNQTRMTMVQENKTYTVMHTYDEEGKYNASIYVANSITTDEDWDARFITVQNDPPIFDLSVPTQAEEDEWVNITVINLQESDHDLQPGVLSYVYDFADGNQTTTNSSFIVHKWINKGTYPLTVTVIDDQVALNQKTQDIIITNRAPEPDFTIGCEIPATYGFYSDLIGAFPFGWVSIDEHYKGTYSFEADEDDQDPSGWTDTSGDGCDVGVYGELDGHKKVIKLNDESIWEVTRIENLIAQTSGTVEFWLYTDDASKTSAISIQDGGFNDELWFGFRNNKFQYHNGSYQSICSASSNKWFHIKIEFDISSDWHLWIDGDSIDNNTGYSFRGSPIEIDKVIFVTDGSAYGYNLYVDGIGYSWDENYEIGDNLIAHESFDAFKVDEGADSHQKILKVMGDDEYNDVEIYNSFDPQSNGTVEYWVMHENVSTSVPVATFSFRDSINDEEFALLVKNDEWYYRASGSDTQLNIDHDPANDTWHHVRVDFLTTGQYMELNPNSFKVIIDGNESAQISFGGDEITRLNIPTDKGFSGRRAYIDAIGYSWDPHYEVGYNYLIFSEEYYATFDFSEEIIGTPPDDEDWYIPPPPSSKDGSFSIIDADGIGGEVGGGGSVPDPNEEVVQITDNSTSVSLIMEHNYTDQAYGSVEFWVQSNNTNEKVWVFCLMQNDVLGIAVLMDDDDWQYTINDVNYYTVGNVGTPENDTWYHVRIDFRCTGADPYFTLQENYFTVSINTVLSPQYQFTTLSSINRTRVTTGGSDTGTAYMDAIGYSWDPYYEIGDNRFPMVHYPEKSLIWFSASQTTDTVNDEGFLSYYWDFGDRSSDFGKYVAHEYTTSGMYPVELTVMDDNGEKSSKTRVVLISNHYPDINFSSFQDEITTFEGTTIIFDTITDDEAPDLARMEYYWHLNGSEFNPYDVTQYTQGGWINSYTFVDDHDGALYAMARDPEGAFDFDALNVTVENVDPSVSIRTMDMIANVTFEVERSTGPPWYDNNFTFVLQSTDKFDLEVPYFFTELNFTGSTETTVNHIQEDMMFDLLKNWKIYANTTSQVSGSVKYWLTLEFKDGEQEVISSEWISSGYAYWEASLDSLWYDETNFTIKHPAEVGVSLWDPSTDDLSLDLNYTVEMIVEIQCSDTLPISNSFDISDTYFYDIYVYESNGKKYANISAYTQVASSEAFNNYHFPVSINNASYTIDPMIDLTELLVANSEGPQLNGFSVVECVSAINGLDAYAEDDDGGSSSVAVGFDTQDDIDIQALCPDINLINNDGGLMTQNISFYLDYYYRSYFREDSDITFKSVSTYGDSDQETSSSPYGDPISDAGSGGDSGYVTTHQSTDSEIDLGSATYNELNNINCSGTQNGNGYRAGTNELGTASCSGLKSMSYSEGSYSVYDTDTYTHGTDYVTNSWQHPDDHFPGYPDYSFRLPSNWPGGWTTINQNGDITRDGWPLGGHRTYAHINYDGSGDSSYMYRDVGERNTDNVEVWLRTWSSDGILSLSDGGSTDIKLLFQHDGVHYRNKHWYGWAWDHWTTAFTDSAWFRVIINLRSDNKFDFFLENSAGTQVYSKLAVTSETGGSIDRVRFYTQTGSPAGSFMIDGYGQTWDSGYDFGQNIHPQQLCNKIISNIPMDSMNKDNWNRATLVRFKVYWKVDYDYYYRGPAAPTFTVKLQGPGGGSGYTTVWSKTNPLDNYWYTSWITISKDYCYGDYDLDFYFDCNTPSYNDMTAPYTLYIYEIQTYWEESRYTGNEYEYCEPGGSIDTGAHEISLSCNNFQRDYIDSFDFDLSWTSSYSKTFYVQLWDYDASSWSPISGPHTGSGSLSASATVTSNPSRFFEDIASPKLKYRLYSTSSSEPTTVIMQSCDVDWSYEYEYDYRHKIEMDNMNEFRYRTLDTARGIDMDFDYNFPLENRDGHIKHKQQNTAAQWQQVGLYENDGDLFDYPFLDKDFILYDGTNDYFYVYHEQEIVAPHNTECELDSMSHYYEWDYSYCDTFSIELSGMNDFRYDHFTSCDINYEVKTHDSESLNIRIYNHANSVWNTLDSFITNGAAWDQELVGTDGYVNFVSKDYILYEASSGMYFVNVSFTGFANPSETIFDILTLETEWDYSYTWDDQFEISLTNMNDFRYDNFEQCMLSFTIDTRSGEPVDIHLWDYTINDWVYQKSMNAGPSYSDSITLTGISNNKYIDSGTYKMKVWFELTQFNPPPSYANSEFDLDSMSVSWEYNFTYYVTYHSQLAGMTQFRYDTFTECLVSYNIDLPRSGKSTDVYLFNFTGGVWDYFKTTQSGDPLSDYFTFYSTDYIESGAYNIRINFTGFSDTEFELNSISYTFDWEYDVQDKYTAHYDMTPHSYDSFESCTIDYSITTSESQSNLQVKLYNYSSSQFVAVESQFSTTKDVGYVGSVVFTSDEFIHSTDYTTRVYFSGIEDSYLTLNWMTTNYSWSHFNAYCDFGHETKGMEGLSYADMTTVYRNVYNASEVFDYAGTYLVTWTVSDGLFETTQGQLIEVVYPPPSVAIGELPDFIIEDQQVPFEANIDLAEGFSYTPPEQISAYLTGFTVPAQNDFDITTGTWNTYTEDSLKFNDVQYSSISAGSGTYYTVDATVEWAVSDPDLYSIDTLRFEHTAPVGINFYVWNYTLGDWLDITLETSPYTLTPDMHSSNTVKVRYVSENSASPFYLQIDQLRIDYTKEIARISCKDIYQYYWDFGDGYFSVDRNPEHQYGYDSNYTATLFVRDLYGNCYNDTIVIEVEEKYPEIIGPYGFSAIEGQAIVLDVAVSDSIFDRKDQTFTWYDENDQEITEFANNQKPTVILNDGAYNYSLEVEDTNGYKDSTDILITVNDIPPSVFIQNYMYHGDANSGSLTLTAYAFDYSKDINTLEFTWRISHNETVDNRGPFSNVNRSSITFDATKTAIYQGEVSVRDPNTDITNIHVFYICSVIDSNGNGFSDEFEQELAENGENIYDYFDTDKDGLSDLYEITHNETDYLDPDTDRDGLYDGVDRSTGMGERPAGTNPIDYDSDDDLLSDGDEVYGWEISIDLEDGIHVSSDPWLLDTDSDGWTDYEEYLYGTHPRNADTDLDGVNDPQDPYPLNADKDEDGLIDSEELAVGTDCGNSDTDEDTLTDAEEVRGGITDPLSADTDRDFLSDSAEVIIKANSIQNRLSLDQPVILQFNHYFQHASAAQITFVLAFGEFNDTVNYGIEDVPDLNVKVSKMDNNLVLYEGNTNGDRYFSHAIDFREVIEDKGYNYYGDYVISVDKTGVGCILEQFDINVAGLLDPSDADSDNDGIMDGIEMDTLTRGTSIINFTSNYASNNITVNNIAPSEPYNFNIEVGSVQLSNTIDQSIVASITFQNKFWFPVVVAYIVSRNEDDSVEVRIDNVTSSGCDIFMEEPSNGGHASETINYIVVEYGEWEFPDGTDIKAGILATDQAHQGGSPYSNWEQVNFTKSFYADPIVLHSLNTYNNEDFKTSIVSEITKSSFNVTQESAETGTSTDEETIAWIAIESGKTGTIDNVKYETLRGNDGDSDGVTPSDNGHVFSFQQSFTNIPDVVVVKQLTVNENDGSWARSDGVLTAASHRTCAEEDQVGDSERNHADEYFGLVAFEEEFSYSYNYIPPEEPETSSYVKSVEHVELMLSGASNSATLSKNQDITKCVPFVTMKQSVGDDWDDIMCDVYFTDSPATVVAERATSGASITLSIFIVEFDGTNVEVQSGTFSATGTYAEQTIDQIDTSKAVPIACYKVAGGDDDWDSSMVTTDFASVTTIRMERHQSSGTMSGHYYVFESKNSEFSVQKAELLLTSSDGYDRATINWVNMSKSFIVSSYECDRANDDPEDAAVDVWLSSETEVRAERHPESSYYNGAPTINVFVVTFGGDDESVQRGDFTWADADSFKEMDITDINLDYSMVKSGQMYGIIQCDGTGSADVKPSFIEHEFVDNNTIRLERYTNSEDGIGHWEVVEFLGVPEDEPEMPEEEPEEEPFDTKYFSIEIPDRGTVYDANLTLTIESDDTPLGYGTVNITLFKEDINCNIDDVELIDYDTEFNEIDVYFNQFIDLTDLVNDETIHQFYGTYRLEVVIFDSSYDDIFNVTQFIIETDTYIQASDDDQNVWITDPSTPDTDGDTISDYAEIYGWTRGSDTFYTNPLSADSDGDGAKDKIDRHPTENVMIKISPLSATHRSQAYWEASPKLEIAISYELNGDDDNRYKIFTPKIRATEDKWSKVILFIRYSHYRRTNFAANDIHYYVDIDDNPNVQPENMDFGFSLWHMDVVDFFGVLLWDNWLAGESVVYSIGDIGHSTTFDIYDTGIWGQDNELHVKVETISVEKANTIAIYKNDTLFNGHYKEKEKMNIIVLEVTGNVQGTPFNQGPNALVIPTELFVETKLNSYLERDKLDETPLYSSVEGEYEFISVGRNGTTEEGCDEVDFVIIRFNIDANDAMTVLSMLITVIVNDTTGEEVELYEYQSTKENGVNAILMNLHKEVLGYIPWYCNFENSDQGDEPDDFFEFWAEVFVGAVMAVVYFVYMIGMAIAELFMALVKFIVAIMMAVLTFLGPLLWLIIRAILLILAFILLAIHLIAQIPVYLMMGASMLIITALMGGYCEFSWNFVEFSLDNKKVFRMQSDIVWVYWDFFDMKFPWVDDKIIIDGEVIMSSKESILGIDSETETEISTTDMFSEVTQTPPSLHSGYNLTSGTTYNFYTTYQDFENDAPDPNYGVKLHLINPDGTTLAPYQMSIHPDYVDEPDYRDGVLYNYTIDLDTIYQGQGLWHYYFTTKDNSSAHDIKFMPNSGYKLGPYIYSCQYIIAEHVSTNYPDEYSRPSGFSTDNFTFVSTWSSEIVPDNMYMCLIPANITTGTGVSKTVGIQKFSMSPVDQSPDYSDYVDYYCTINFTELGYNEEELGRFNHYYEAVYDNGNKTYLYDAEGEDYFDMYYCDFRTPYVGTTGAQLIDYHFEGTNFLSSLLLGHENRDGTLPINRILISEMQVRFEVIFMDPSGEPPLENYPQLIFTNIATGEELFPYVLWEPISTQFSMEYGFEVSSYSCVVDVIDLPPGVWKFKFEAKDSEGLPVDTLYGAEKLWVWGSAMEIMSGFSLTTLTSGTIPLISYITALPLGKGGTWASVAASILAIGGTVYAIYQMGTSWWNFVQSGNAGALLGLCLGTLFACLATSNAFASSFGKITEYFGNILLFLFTVESVVSLLPMLLGFWDVPWDIASVVLNFIYLPIEFFLLITTSIAAGLAMQSIGKAKSASNKVIKACMKMMLMFQALISIASFFSWVKITQGWYIWS